MNPSTNGTNHDADADIDTLYSFWPALKSPQEQLPEAAFSLTVKGRLDGQDAMLTVRGATVAQFTANLKAVRGLLDAPQAPAPAPEKGRGYCRIHQIHMTNNEKHGKRWFSHRLPTGDYCKGR